MRQLHNQLSVYRFEFLLTALLFLLFDKIFFPDDIFYINYVWPFNMLFLGIASAIIFKERNKTIIYTKNILFLFSIVLPFLFRYYYNQVWFVEFLMATYIIYYTLIFIETMRQITRRDEVTLSVVLGSFCGYLLLSLIAAFSFFIIEFNYTESFSGITSNNVSAVYNELIYFSFVTLTSIGFGDILPKNDTARLTTAFFGFVGQFYMVVLVGIIVSKFTAK